MKKDLEEILKKYEENLEEARSELYTIFPGIYSDVVKKKGLTLQSQELYTFYDLIMECFLYIDYFLVEIISNGYKKPIFKSGKIIGFSEKILTIKEIKGYIYQSIGRVIQNMATEKGAFKVPFNKNGTAVFTYTNSLPGSTYSITRISRDITYGDEPGSSSYIGEGIFDNKGFQEDFGYDNELEKEYLMSIIYNVVGQLSYQDKKLFVQRYIHGMSSELIAKDWGISKKSMLTKIHILNAKIKKKVRNEEIDTRAFAGGLHSIKDICDGFGESISVENNGN